MGADAIRSLQTQQDALGAQQEVLPLCTISKQANRLHGSSSFCLRGYHWLILHRVEKEIKREKN